MNAVSKTLEGARCAAVGMVNCRVVMRDGVELAADIYLPPAMDRPVPCLLSYSPYGATRSRPDGMLSAYVAKGVAVAMVDCRGLCNSDGEFSPWPPTMVGDAWDLLEWLSSQPWCNGRIAMVGGSYPGATQLSCMRSGHPALAVCAPSAVTLDPYSIYYSNGAQVVAFQGGWHIGIATHAPAPKGAPSFAEAMRGPVGRIPERMGISCPSWEEQCRHEGRDAFWAAKGDLAELARSRAGAFYQGSWFDRLGVAVFETFDLLRKVCEPGAAESARRHTCLRVGPWGHGVNVREGEIDYGPEATVTEDAELDFIHSLLDGREPGTSANPAPIQIFTMGRNEWRFIPQWPPPDAVMTPIYLGSGGGANTAGGDGTLSFAPPAAGVGAASDTFVFDPANPVPSCGGRDVGAGGQRDQREVEKRSDVLVYTGDPLGGEVEVTGRVEAAIYVRSSALDTDFTVKLVDVFPDGRAMSVLDGICRARWRDGLDRPPRLLAPGEVTELRFFVDVTSYCFMPGHRIRVEVSSSNFPHFAVNPNAGGDNAFCGDFRIAVQEVFHDSQRPSAVLLPIVGRGGAGA